MDLSNLQSTLPPDLADAQRDIGDKFRAAAASIAALYKSSLSVTKQGYNAGYSQALIDLLSTVQSSIGEGQDSAQALSRLMDWADARQAAISAFAADEAEDTSAPSSSQPRPQFPHRQSHLIPTRPASAPALDRLGAGRPPAGRPVFGGEGDVTVNGRVGTSRLRGEGDATPSRNGALSTYQPTPAPLLSSPLDSPSSHLLAPTTKPSRGLPIRFTSSSSSSSSLSHQPQHHAESSSQNRLDTPPNTLPSSTFNPSLPPLPAATSAEWPNMEGAQDGAPGQDYPTGAKRPIVESMDVEEPAVAAVPVGISLAPGSAGGGTRTQGRAAKRRSMGTVKDDDEKVERGKRGRGRHGHGGGGAGTGL
ncbi:hypothetical protein L198_08078 [Cryptococcus wingfieldii CBS 7118]|uniref:Uncharacterized protein n=1 Tax=Cryptococcus wingfieldii CBS 7118 TaxID=1295528 RepID=A0A1E3HJ77_9TREE|nr:hypothetical protein L198_08078 [Cryptococcus wingfieldii CBS 7118]ODN76394.1 hypothetical protein L198_08078 [Cryptococcus wingfieldii CBS 7118]